MGAKLTPDQLHRLIDAIAALAYRDRVVLEGDVLYWACLALGSHAGCDWWYGQPILEFRKGGLSAVLILLSEGG